MVELVILMAWRQAKSLMRPHLAACEKIGAPMSPKTEKKCWGQSLYAIMDIGSPKTIRVCHIFRFSKNPKILENLDFLGY